MLFSRFACALTLALALPHITLAEPASLKDANNAAHYLAGLQPPHSAPKKLLKSDAWEYHQQQLDKEWSRYESSTLEPMRQWAASEVKPSGAKSKVVRYMFSGPDILHVLQMFPDAETFILCGLEPVGALPGLEGFSAGEAQAACAQIRKSLEESIQFSFFKTIDMKDDLRNSVIPGTLPIMSVFLARCGETIEEIDYVEINADGTLTSLGPDAKGASAVRLKFSSGGKTRQLYYFSTDISNGDVLKNGFMAFLESQPVGDSYVKAASYLMHNSYFSNIRNHLLSFSNLLLQDDSGIPLSQFIDSRWEITHYGTYTAPIELFAEHYQANLRAAYKSGSAQPLGFGTGYRWRKNESNLMRALMVEPTFR